MDVSAHDPARGVEPAAPPREVLAAYTDLVRALIGPVDPSRIAWIVLDHAKRLTGSPFGYVGHIDPTTGYLVTTTMTRDIWQTCAVAGKSVVFDHFSGLWGWVLDNRRSLLTNDPVGDSRSTGTPEGHIPIENFLSAPAMVDGRLVGQVAVANAPGGYHEDSLRIVEELASLYAVALDREWSDQRLADSEGRFRSLYEQSPIAIESFDADGRLLHVNQACVELFGLVDPQDIRGFDLFSDPNLTPALWERIRRGETVHIEHDFDFEKVKASAVYRTTRSGIIHLDTLVTPLGEHPEREPQGYLVHIQDFTERTRARTELLHHRERLEELVAARTCELQEALDNVKTLRGLVPICASCKRIRDDGGCWHQVEVYVTHHTDAEFSHGLCPECLTAIYHEHLEDGPPAA
jgi:PAS domain S-box-containing protein